MNGHSAKQSHETDLDGQTMLGIRACVCLKRTRNETYLFETRTLPV